MNVNKNSWHYKVYCFTYNVDSSAVPMRTNLCQYVSRLAFGAPVIAISIALLFTMFYLMVVPFAFLLGYRPAHNPAYAPEPFVSYKGLNIGFMRLYPWQAILLVAACYLLRSVFVHQRTALYWGSGVAAGIIAIVMLLTWFYTADTPKVWRAWLAAKKAGVCPVVEFSNEETDTK